MQGNIRIRIMHQLMPYQDNQLGAEGWLIQDFYIHQTNKEQLNLQECKDTLRDEDCQGRQLLHRFVRIPFTISYFSGNIKMMLKVENRRPENEVRTKYTFFMQHTSLAGCSCL